MSVITGLAGRLRLGASIRSLRQGWSAFDIFNHTVRDLCRESLGLCPDVGENVHDTLPGSLGAWATPPPVCTVCYVDTPPFLRGCILASQDGVRSNHHERGLRAEIHLGCSRSRPLALSRPIFWRVQLQNHSGGSGAASSRDTLRRPRTRLVAANRASVQFNLIKRPRIVLVYKKSRTPP